MEQVLTAGCVSNMAVSVPVLHPGWILNLDFCYMDLPSLVLLNRTVIYDISIASCIATKSKIRSGSLSSDRELGVRPTGCSLNC